MDKRKRARKKREAETSLYSLALYNAQRSYSTKLSLGTLSILQGYLLYKSIYLDSLIAAWGAISKRGETMSLIWDIRKSIIYL
jgi:hypothetical protein